MVTASLEEVERALRRERRDTVQHVHDRPGLTPPHGCARARQQLLQRHPAGGRRLSIRDRCLQHRHPHPRPKRGAGCRAQELHDDLAAGGVPQQRKRVRPSLLGEVRQQLAQVLHVALKPSSPKLAVRAAEDRLHGGPPQGLAWGDQRLPLSY
jgi:hypothetical protein